ncbi:hypothetical protein OY671_011215, partial [Metschnikowia pulcherrima]
PDVASGLSRRRGASSRSQGEGRMTAQIVSLDSWRHAGFLTSNAGSSSSKVASYPAHGEKPSISGQADRIGPEGTLKSKDGAGNAIPIAGDDISTHQGASAAVIATIKTQFPESHSAAIGHRVVHGGPTYSQPVVVTDE